MQRTALTIFAAAAALLLNGTPGQAAQAQAQPNGQPQRNGQFQQQNGQVGQIQQNDQFQQLNGQLLPGETLALSPTAASSLTNLWTSQMREVETLRAQQERFQALGYNNVVRVYEQMIQDHLMVAMRAQNLLTAGGRETPALPTALPNMVSDRPLQMLDRMIAHHRQSVSRAEQTAAALPDPKVKSVFYLSASGASKHLGWMLALRPDVIAGRTELTDRAEVALLASGAAPFMPGTAVAGTQQEIGRIQAERVIVQPEERVGGVRQVTPARRRPAR